MMLVTIKSNRRNREHAFALTGTADDVRPHSSLGREHRASSRGPQSGVSGTININQVGLSLQLDRSRGAGQTREHQHA